jgi:hypothetical protein
MEDVSKLSEDRNNGDISIQDTNNMEENCVLDISIPDVDKLVEITTKCVSLTSESDSTPVDNNCIQFSSILLVS